VTRHIADGLDHPECVAWDPRGFVYAGGEAGQLYRIEVASGSVNEVATTHGWILGICLDSEGSAYLCDPNNHCVYVAGDDGSIRQLSTGTPDLPMSLPNFPVFAKDGSLFVSDSGTWEDVSGRIYRIQADGATEVWSDSAPHFTNGLALAADEDYLYVVESTLPGVSRIRINPDGTAGDCEVVVLMPGTVPDGLAFDVEGGLYIACYRPDRVYRLSTSGQLEVVVDDFQGTEIGAPTNVAFGGSDMKTLFMASLARWHIGAIDVEVPGLELHRPQGITPQGESQ
jgi:gluconolactonase